MNISEQRRFPGSYLDWKDIAFFRKSEWEGHLHETSTLLIRTLDGYRRKLGAPVYISPGNWGNHSATGFHYPQKETGNMIWAVDIFPACPLQWAYHIAITNPCFCGVGVYPFWSWADRGLKGGLHLDIRESNKTVWYYENGYTTVKDSLSLRKLFTLLHYNNQEEHYAN